MQEVRHPPIRRGGAGQTFRKTLVDDAECAPRGVASDRRRDAFLKEFVAQPDLQRVQGGFFERLAMKWEAGRWQIQIERDEV